MQYYYPSIREKNSLEILGKINQVKNSNKNDV